MWMIKSKFSEHIRSKTDTAIVNELLCKVLCHNICVVIQSMYELDIEPIFWAKEDNVRQSYPDDHRQSVEVRTTQR